MPSLLKPRCETPATEHPTAFRNALGSWFSSEGKDYPWRRTKDPYQILVSEMMLQQTRVATVLGKGYYTRFIEKFPDVHSLAAAPDDSLLKAWEGLGYYRRARMLRAAAIHLVENSDGKFPEDEAGLLTLPGIGPYTSSALAAFAFGKSSGLVDGNVSRVLSRLTDDPSPIDSSATVTRHRKISLALCDPAHPARHHHAMMELGQTYCRPGRPDCLTCPVGKFCITRHPGKLPVKKPRPTTTRITEHAIWSRDPAGRLLLHRESGSRRQGLWKLPVRSKEECENLELVATEPYTITRYLVTLLIHVCPLPELREGDSWTPPEDLPEIAMAAPFRRAVIRLGIDF